MPMRKEEELQGGEIFGVWLTFGHPLAPGEIIAQPLIRNALPGYKGLGLGVGMNGDPS